MGPQVTGSSLVHLVLVVDAGVVLQAGPLLPVLPLGDVRAPGIKARLKYQEGGVGCGLPMCALLAT